MARGINKAIIVGTLGKNPDIKHTAGGSTVVNISVATNETWKDKNTGQMVEKTDWHRIVIFGKLAEIAAQYLKKGAQVYFEGKIQTRKWQDTQTGQDRYTTEIIANEMQMLGSKPPDATSNHDSTDYRQASQGTTPAKPPADDDFKDIPF